MKMATKAGVINIPSKFESVAAHTAAATFPPAIDVNAIEDWTVDGNNVKYSNPAANAGSSPGIRISINPKIGNKTKVTVKVEK